MPSHFEEDMKKLENIVEKMSQGSLSLEESISLFEQGLKISKKCTDKLNQAQQKVQKIISTEESTPKVEDCSKDFKTSS